MKYLILTILFALSMSCDKKVSQDLPMKKIEKVTEDTEVSIESELRILRKEISGVNKTRAFERLDEHEKTKLDKRLLELKKSLNETISLLRVDYTNKEKRALQTSFNKTKSIWKYLIKNYQI